MPRTSFEPVKCSLCRRTIPENKFLEKHHLTPKQAKGKETVPVCCPCGDQIHQLFTNKELEKEFNTVEILLSDERIQKWIQWIRKTDKWYVCMKEKKRKR